MELFDSALSAFGAEVKDRFGIGEGGTVAAACVSAVDVEVPLCEEEVENEDDDEDEDGEDEEDSPGAVSRRLSKSCFRAATNPRRELLGDASSDELEMLRLRFPFGGLGLLSVNPVSEITGCCC